MAMLLFLLRRRRLPLLPPAPRCDRLPLLFSSSAGADGVAPSAKPLSIVEHLVTRWGISAAEASKASKPLAHLNSTQKPDSVLAFLKSQGFGSSHLGRIVALWPRLLCANVEKNLAPKLLALRDLGFSELDVVEIVTSNRSILCYDVERTLLPKLQFWETFFGSRERLIKNLRISKVRPFFNFNIEKRVNPNVKFLMDECGVTKERVFLVAKNNVDFIVLQSDTLRSLIGRADELGVPRQSRGFLWVMSTLSRVGADKVDAHLKVMASFGWSKSEFCQAVGKAPNFLPLSQNELQKKMKFLVEEVGYEPSSISHRPIVLSYSLEKRMIPRVRVMEMLQSKGLAAEDKSLDFLLLTEERFLEKFLLPHTEKVPDLLHILGVPEKGDQQRL